MILSGTGSRVTVFGTAAPTVTSTSGAGVTVTSEKSWMTVFCWSGDSCTTVSCANAGSAGPANNSAVATKAMSLFIIILLHERSLQMTLHRQECFFDRPVAATE